MCKELGILLNVTKEVIVVGCITGERINVLVDEVSFWVFLS
jgi:hypothetical protein